MASTRSTSSSASQPSRRRRHLHAVSDDAPRRVRIGGRSYPSARHEHVPARDAAASLLERGALHGLLLDERLLVGMLCNRSIEPAEVQAGVEELVRRGVCAVVQTLDGPRLVCAGDQRLADMTVGEILDATDSAQDAA